MKRFINTYNWEEINYASKVEDWKRFEKVNSTIALNVLYTKEIEIYPAYYAKINSNCGKQVILIMIPNNNKRKLVFACFKKVSASLRRRMSKFLDAFY